MKIELTKEELELILNCIERNPKYYLFTNVIGVTDKTTLSLRDLYWKLSILDNEDN